MQFKYHIRRANNILKNEGFLILLKKIYKLILNTQKIDLDTLIINSPNNLDDIFIKFGTDKGSLDGKKTYEFIYKNSKDKAYKNYFDWINRKNLKDHPYQLGLNSSPIYEKIFTPRRYEKLKILELGVANGHSIASWHHFFPNSEVFGIDIKKPYKFFYKSKRVKYFEIDIFNKKKIDQFIIQHGNFDYIIDDSMNSRKSMLLNFKNFFPSIKSVGAYFLEDTGFYDLVKNAFKEIKQYNKKNNASYFLDSQTIVEVFTMLKNKNLKNDNILDEKFLSDIYLTINDVEFGRYDHPYAGMIIIHKK